MSEAQTLPREPNNCEVTQLVECRAHNPNVAGSSPAFATKHGECAGAHRCFASNFRSVRFRYSPPKNAKIAQLVERELEELGVTGSIPVLGTNQAPMAKTVYASDLKSDTAMVCQFDPGLEHQALLCSSIGSGHLVFIQGRAVRFRRRVPNDAVRLAK